jgi:hypothetical protein
MVALYVCVGAWGCRVSVLCVFSLCVSSVFPFPVSFLTVSGCWSVSVSSLVVFLSCLPSFSFCLSPPRGCRVTTVGVGYVA